MPSASEAGLHIILAAPTTQHRALDLLGVTLAA